MIMEEHYNFIKVGIISWKIHEKYNLLQRSGPLSFLVIFMVQVISTFHLNKTSNLASNNKLI